MSGVSRSWRASCATTSSLGPKKRPGCTSPRPQDYFADPAAYSRDGASQFAGRPPGRPADGGGIIPRPFEEQFDPTSRWGTVVGYRVIQWATGGVGRAAMEGVLAHPELELAGAWVHSPDKEGADLGTLLGRDQLGVTATGDVDALLATEADCVLYSPIFADPGVVAAILESGKNVVSPLGWFYPPPEERQKFDTIAKAAGVTLHGTGINPGGITERFPLMISALSGSVTHVRAEEYSDIRTYGAPDVVRDWMLFGKTPEEARASVMIDALGGGFRQSIFMVADEMGFDVDPQLADHARNGGGDGADRLTDRAHPTGDGGGATVYLGGHRRRGAGGDGDRELADGRGGSRAGMDLRAGRRALRGRDHGRSELSHHLQEAAPQDDRGGTRPEPGRRRHGHALCQRHPVRLSGRARAAHLPGDASGGRPGCTGRASGPAGIELRPPGMILHRFSLGGKVAIVTGAGLGIGRGIAIGLAEAGADVVLAARTESDLEEVATHIRSSGRRALVVPTDVTDAAACEQLVLRAVEEFGRLDILVNNAGGAMPRAALDTSEGFMARTFAFNVTAPLTLTKLAARQMVDTVGRGAVVNISSRSASMTQTMFVAYGAAKAALDRMTRKIAPELAPRVRVNAIDVGGVATRSLDIVLTDEDSAAAVSRRHADGTAGRARGHRLCGPLSRFGRLVLGHRQGLRNRRRDRGSRHDGARPCSHSDPRESRRLLRPRSDGQRRRPVS